MADKDLRQIEKEEARLLDLIRACEFGEIVVQVKHGKPFMASRERKDIKLTD